MQHTVIIKYVCLQSSCTCWHSGDKWLFITLITLQYFNNSHLPSHFNNYFSGISGSGKTHTCLQLLRQLFDIAGGGPETDTFKHLRATCNVLRSMGTAATIANPESSRTVSILVTIQSTLVAMRQCKAQGNECITRRKPSKVLVSS